MQLCSISERPDADWAPSAEYQNQLMQDINTTRNLAGELVDGKGPINISLQFDYTFTRSRPPLKTQVHTLFNRTLDYSVYHDCRSG